MKWNEIKEKIDDWAVDYVPGPIYRIPFFISKRIDDVRHLLQKLFFKNHTSYREIWNLYSYMAPYIYRKLNAFYEADRVSYPIAFSEYDDKSFPSKEEYDKEVADGSIVGGGSEGWNNALREMLFAFDFYANADSGNKKKEKKFYERWNLENPFEEKEENKYISSIVFLNDKDGVFYHNFELEQEYYKRAQKGAELFGKYFTSLWD